MRCSNLLRHPQGVELPRGNLGRLILVSRTPSRRALPGWTKSGEAVIGEKRKRGERGGRETFCIIVVIIVTHSHIRHVYVSLNNIPRARREERGTTGRPRGWDAQRVADFRGKSMASPHFSHFPLPRPHTATTDRLPPAVPPPGECSTRSVLPLSLPSLVAPPHGACFTFSPSSASIHPHSSLASSTPFPSSHPRFSQLLSHIPQTQLASSSSRQQFSGSALSIPPHSQPPPVCKYKTPSHLILFVPVDLPHYQL